MQPEAAENTEAPQKSRPQIKGLAVEIYAPGKVMTCASVVCMCGCVFISELYK